MTPKARRKLERELTQLHNRRIRLNARDFHGQSEAKQMQDIERREHEIIGLLAKRAA